MKAKELLAEWLTYEKGRVKVRTHARYESLLALHILPFLGECELHEVHRRDIQAFLLEKSQGGGIRTAPPLSASSVNLIRSILHAAFDYGRDMELLTENPCERVRRMPDAAREITAFSKRLVYTHCRD